MTLVALLLCFSRSSCCCWEWVRLMVFRRVSNLFLRGKKEGIIKEEKKKAENMF